MGAARIEQINKQIAFYFPQHHPGIVYEDNSDKVRGAHGLHLYDPFFKALTSEPVCLDTCKQFLEDEVYIHQFKINTKRALVGESWPWHQDYVFWQNSDHIPRERLLNVAIFLDNITMLHGPLCVIHNSHTQGNLTKPIESQTGTWKQDVSINLTYQVHHQDLVSLMADNEVEFVTGKSGDVLFFDPQLVHCSSNNLSVDDRNLLFMTYNALSNKPLKVSGRPEFLSARDFTAIG